MTRNDTTERAALRHPPAAPGVARALFVALLAVTSSGTLLACRQAPPATRPAPGVPTPPALTVPPLVEAPRFRHRRSHLVAASGPPRHRGRDVLVAEGDPQELEAKIAYGVVDKDLSDEDVDVFLVDPGDGPLRLLGTSRTSRDGTSGPDDDGGRARLHLTGASLLPRGHHVVRFVVRGDGTSADSAVVVVAPGTRAFVSDVDGTLTSSEWAEVPAAIEGSLPEAHPDAARIFLDLAEQGMLPIYLTARPEWLVPRTRRFLAANGFPRGVLVTKRDKSGALGAAAAAYKKAELARLASIVTIEWAFGNKPSDAEAYAAVVRDPRRRVLFGYDDVKYGGRRIDAYRELSSEASERTFFSAP